MSSVQEGAKPASYHGMTSIPVGLMMASERVDGQWRSRVDGILSGARFEAAQPQQELVRDGEGLRLYLWKGFRLHLRKRYVDDYSLNIRNAPPAVFVVGRYTAPGEFQPFLVTLSMDEAQKLDAPELRDSHEHVVQARMPPEIYRWLEEFVLDHYEPRRPKGKRRREE